MTDSSAGRTPQGDGPFVITLCSTGVPMMLQLPLLSVFAGLTVFRSRVIEEGRERFRMHLGYFYDRDRAERVLVAARRFYPGAFVAQAPDSGMGSLDDTMNSAFQFAKGPATRLVAAERLPTSEEFESAIVPAARQTSDAAAASQAPVYDDTVGAEAEQDEAVSSTETPLENAAPVEEPPAPAFPESVATTVAIEPSTAVLDVAAAPAPRSDDARDPARPRERGSFAVQRYAVQLKWSINEVDPGSIPHHALFKQFTLYGVTVQRGNASEHGLRLGFFSNLYSAKQVADYVRHDFPYASVVPVSERELVRAQQAAWNELLARVGVQARGASVRAPDSEDSSQGKPVRRDFGLRRLWGRQS